MQVLDDVGQHVHADQIKGAKGRGLGTADGRTGDLIDFFNRITVFEHRLNRYQRAKGADAVGDEVGPVLRDDHAFAEALIQKAEHRT